MSRKTILKTRPRAGQEPPKFTRRSKRLFKKFTIENRVFWVRRVIFGVCKWNLPILPLKTPQKCCFCAHFCLFCHIKKQNILFGKFHLPIFSVPFSMFRKKTELCFCTPCTNCERFFLHSAKRTKKIFFIIFHPIFLFFRIFSYFLYEKKQKKRGAESFRCRRRDPAVVAVQVYGRGWERG